MIGNKNMVGEKLRKLRKDKGLTQQQVEQLTGIAQKNISSYESGKLVPSGKTLQKFASALGVEVLELASEHPAEPVLAISDGELLQMFRELQKLPDSDKSKVKWMLGLAIKQHQVQAVMAS